MIIMILFNNNLCVNCIYRSRILFYLLVATPTTSMTFSRKFSDILYLINFINLSSSRS